MALMNTGIAERIADTERREREAALRFVEIAEELQLTWIGFERALVEAKKVARITKP